VPILEPVTLACAKSCLKIRSDSADCTGWFQTALAVVIAVIEAELGIKLGETLADGAYSVECTRCIGRCDQGAAARMNGTGRRVYGQSFGRVPFGDSGSRLNACPRADTGSSY